MNLKRHISKRTFLLTITFTILIVFILIAIVCNRLKEKNVLSGIHFLKVYGSINYLPDQDNRLSIGFITKGVPIHQNEPFSFQIDSNYVVANNAVLTKSISYNNYTLWYIAFDLSIKTDKIEKKCISIDHVSINNYANNDIGSLTFNIINNKNSLFSYLSLKSCDGAALEETLSNYHATFENISNKKIVISNIEIPYFEQAKPSLQ